MNQQPGIILENIKTLCKINGDTFKRNNLVANPKMENNDPLILEESLDDETSSVDSNSKEKIKEITNLRIAKLLHKRHHMDSTNGNYVNEEKKTYYGTKNFVNNKRVINKEYFRESSYNDKSTCRTPYIKNNLANISVNLYSEIPTNSSRFPYLARSPKIPIDHYYAKVGATKGSKSLISSCIKERITVLIYHIIENLK